MDKAGECRHVERLMELMRVIAELRFRRDHVEQAIQWLERLSVTRPPKRGRPPQSWTANRSAGLPTEVRDVRRRAPEAEMMSRYGRKWVSLSLSLPQQVV